MIIDIRVLISINCYDIFEYIYKYESILVNYKLMKVP